MNDATLRMQKVMCQEDLLQAKLHQLRGETVGWVSHEKITEAAPHWRLHEALMIPGV